MSKQIFVHPSEARCLDVFVKIDIEKLENDNVVPSKVEAVQHTHDAIFVGVFIIDARQKTCLNLTIVSLLFLVLTDFDCHCLASILHINAAHYLAERTCIYDFVNQVAIAQLLAKVSSVEALSVCNTTHALDSDATNSVYKLVSRQFSHLKRSKLALVLLKRLNRCHPFQNLLSVLLVWQSCEVWAGV